jgi:putative ATPase
MELFDSPPTQGKRLSQPLADSMRPKTLDEFVGQEHLLGPGKLVRGMVCAGELRSMILWGPPGSGKTTLAQILARSAGAACVHFSAVSSGVKDLKRIIEEAQNLGRLGKATVLFVDEIHHFNKSQQDNFLPHVERGTLTLIGATTENPSFELISPLLSRCRVLVLKPLLADDVGTVVDRALTGHHCGSPRFLNRSSARRLSRRPERAGNRGDARGEAATQQEHRHKPFAGSAAEKAAPV